MSPPQPRLAQGRDHLGLARLVIENIAVDPWLRLPAGLAAASLGFPGLPVAGEPELRRFAYGGEPGVSPPLASGGDPEFHSPC